MATRFLGRRQAWWNVADICEAVAAEIPDHIAISQGDRKLRWRDFDRRADGLAATLLHAGLQQQDRVALYMYNSPEYLESFVAATKASLVPVNTNFRYRDGELAYLWSNADAAAVIFHGRFSETAGRVRRELPGIKAWVWVDDGTGECPSWATPYETAATTPTYTAAWPRSIDDLIFLYTGGTTGLPKGVMFKQCQMLALPMRFAPTELNVLVRGLTERGPGDTMLIAPPLMHGTGTVAALQALLSGGTASLLPSRRFDPIELWDTVDRDDVTQICIVGDAFARPMCDALQENVGRWQIRKLNRVVSAGAMFSEGVKHELMGLVPGLSIFDQLGSTENGGAGTLVSSAGTNSPTGTFELAPGVRVIDGDNRDVVAGSGVAGRIAIPGGAIGYHKDPDRSAQTFLVLDGRRYTVAGDFATIESDGTVRLLGRGSQCINTGGEKVFAEEVEEVLKSHPGVNDAVVVGTPHQRFGSVVTAVVEATDDADDEALVEHVRAVLAAYKAPRHIVRVASLGRAPNGKADYPTIRTLAIEQLSRAAKPTDGKRSIMTRTAELTGELVGAVSEPIPVRWTKKDVLLYACGIGATPEHELDFLYEGHGPKVFPTFASIRGGAGAAALAKAGVKLDLSKILHGAQSVVLHRELPAEATATATGRVKAVWDKGSAAVIDTETTVFDDAGPLFTESMSVFVRGAGGFGGERGPSTSGLNSPPDRPADHIIEFKTRPEQAAIYRLSGDRNPIHIDPVFAQKAGFDAPFLHGLCTYGIVGRAIVRSLCGGDPTRFRSMEGRFADRVELGDTVITKLWRTGDGEAIVVAETQHSNVVLSQALTTWSD